MAQIAHDLGARLQGDDGEFYGPEGGRWTDRDIGVGRGGPKPHPTEALAA
jgi:hypothetical protein